MLFGLICARDSSVPRFASCFHRVDQPPDIFRRQWFYSASTAFFYHAVRWRHSLIILNFQKLARRYTIIYSRKESKPFRTLVSAMAAMMFSNRRQSTVYAPAHQQSGTILSRSNDQLFLQTVRVLVLYLRVITYSVEEEEEYHQYSIHRLGGAVHRRTRLFCLPVDLASLPLGPSLLTAFYLVAREKQLPRSYTCGYEYTF